MSTAGTAQSLDQLRSEQIAALYHNAMPGTWAGTFAGLVISGVLAWVQAIPVASALVFASLLVITSLARYGLVLLYRRTKRTEREWRRWAYAATASTLAGGLLWGFGSWLLLDPTRVELQFLVFLVCAALAAGAVTAFATYLPAYYCNLLCIMVPGAVWSATWGDILHLTYTLLVVLWIGAMIFLARNYNHFVADSLRLQIENYNLATDLLRQKELAEEASVAKSRFLASASHDLRQPVHALGMFVGALRERKMDAESYRLVDQIDGSLSALDGLFTSLLDISRLDAGVIQARTEAFAVGPLLERICRDEASPAAQKGVGLKLVPSSAVVRSDPVLIERIVRNLVSNAVRYTETGRVLIGCRPAGDRVSIEVWDSGPGIPIDEQDLIFQEFYQIGNPERDRTRGLGLGLAIVRRLTSILHTPLTLRSRMGKGSAFMLSVARASAPARASVPAIDAAAATPNPRFVLLVDDEVAIQEAMRSLLTAWGHTVTVAGSGDELIERIASSTMPPDLIISDYRLRAGEKGTDVIQRIRSEFNEDIPGILITGDTAPDRLKEASESGCFLMHKPVPNGKLRAAITNLTMQRPDAEARV